MEEKKLTTAQTHKELELDVGVWTEIMNSACLTAKAVSMDRDHNEVIQYYNSMLNSAVKGETASIKAILAAQACTLDTVFNDSVRRAKSGNFESALAYFDVALKAQKQCRQTLSTLATVINPPEPTFVRQQNNAINQQVNNGVEIVPEKKSANELLMETENEAMDTRGTFKAVQPDSELEAVEAINGSQDGQR